VAGPKRYSLADVRRSYTPEKARAELRGELPAYLVYRPLSFPITWLLLGLGVPTWLVTVSGGALAVGVLAAAVSGGPHAYLCVAGLGLGFHVLDCVDGNMARTTGRTSRFGALLDGLCDYTFWSALLCALGVLVERENAAWFAPHGTELGMACAIVVLLARDVRQHFALLHGESAVFSADDAARAPTLGQWTFYALAGLENVYVLAIAGFGAFGALHHVLLGVSCYVVVIAVVSITLTLRKAGVSADGAEHEASVLPAERE
jgi:phosphatidylglycerophosphate synthase